MKLDRRRKPDWLVAEEHGELAVRPRGNLYTYHPLMVDSGTFWRCRHGYSDFGDCWRCGVFHPLRFIVSWWANRA